MSRITINLTVEGEPTTEAEKRIIDALGHCTFLPGSFDKRFARDTLWQQRNVAEPLISAKQRTSLWKMAKRYRRQMPAEINRLVDGGPS